MAHLDNSAGAQPAPSGPTTKSQDVLAGVFAGLLPLGGGLLVLAGWALLQSAFGAILGGIGAIAWAVWWRNKHQSFFPTHLQGGSVGGVAALTVLAGLVFWLSL
ncbi:hypothetical protein IQ251_01805 [Saccharopolyspora sp. HNM0983]|uniref:Uncharacterized protein n=1 Tax=Saccharopolyspora montiporae TaxID=2781240 RepID=A0A929FY71_9PSEU|nr:hypothetical protein [Saccharopolyspora sp. HNM0983]MBE9373175.1 hypothetical protein [Saccharopolyspora sp. HNM0983]